MSSETTWADWSCDAPDPDEYVEWDSKVIVIGRAIPSVLDQMVNGTDALPGTEQKQLVLTLRDTYGLPLWHPKDNTGMFEYEQAGSGEQATFDDALAGRTFLAEEERKRITDTILDFRSIHTKYDAPVQPIQTEDENDAYLI